MTTSKLLFILKKREMTYEEDNCLYSSQTTDPKFKYCLSPGLRNSASFVVDMLNLNGVEAKLVEVIDNNCIDREVTLYKPTVVIIEAFWVVPEKFHILQKLHPGVIWIVRNHSELPFLANEGIAVHWALQYIKHHNVYLAPNSERAFEDAKKMVSASLSTEVAEKKVILLPNYYPIDKTVKFPKREPLGDTVNVGCFGAVRPLKNHLLQAVAAIDFAREKGIKLKFHINVARIEDAGNNSLKSLRGLFANLDSNQYQLVEHGWLDHDDFLKLVATMDIGLQASFTETFNIVTADFVSQGIPVVTSNEIEWLDSQFYCDHTDAQDIADMMDKVLSGYNWRLKAYSALRGLERYDKKSEKIWLSYFGPK